MWTGVQTGAELYDRLHKLPGYGGEKAKIFMALLAKRFDPPGRLGRAGQAVLQQQRTGRSPMSSSPETLLEVRAFKKVMKAKGKGKDGEA